MTAAPANERADLDGEAAVEIVPASRLEELRAEWSALWRSCRSATPFQAPGWLLPWARHYAQDRCGAAVLRAGGRLAALLPVFTWRGSLLLAGTGPSDYGDGLFLPGTGKESIRLISALATIPGHGFDRIELRQLRPASPLLAAPAPEGWRDEVLQDETCPVLRLEGQDGMDAASRRWRANWRYSMRRIAREGGTFDLAPTEDVTGAIAALERLHAVRWQQRGETGVLSDPLLCRLLRDAVPELAAAGIPRLHRLRFGDTTAAILLVLRGRRDAYYYLSGFDPAYSTLSPGTALVGQAIAQAAQDGTTAFHFLRGREAYKYRWGAEDRSTCRRVLTNPERGPF